MSFLHPLFSQETSNSNLLKILTKRSSANKSIHHKDWPGKQSPNLINISSQRKRPQSLSISLKAKPKCKTQSRLAFTQSSEMKLVRSVPIIRMNTKSLCLRSVPTNQKPKSRTILLNSAFASTPNPNIITSRVYQSKIDESVSQQCKNTRACTTKSHLKGNVQNSKRIISNNVDFDEFQQNCEQKDVLQKYVVDYAAFNYVQKVLDSPQKWRKFIYKKMEGVQNQFITNIGL